jgi:motility quorum-sensing regulator/GCU-specific mRNA interferase toxin
MTRTARDGALALGFSLDDVVAVIRSMTRQQFHKSMTSHNDSKIWQDVYHVPAGDTTLYVKFTMDGQGKLLISFKEK